MNKIFKVIWSRTKNCYVTASELAKGHTKSASTGSNGADDHKRPRLYQC